MKRQRYNYEITNQAGEVYATGSIWLNESGRVMVTDDDGDVLTVENLIEDADRWHAGVPPLAQVVDNVAGRPPLRIPADYKPQFGSHDAEGYPTGNRLDDGSNEAIADREDFDRHELGG